MNNIIYIKFVKFNTNFSTVRGRIDSVLEDVRRFCENSQKKTREKCCAIEIEVNRSRGSSRRIIQTRLAGKVAIEDTELKTPGISRTADGWKECRFIETRTKTRSARSRWHVPGDNDSRSFGPRARSPSGFRPLDRLPFISSSFLSFFQRDDDRTPLFRSTGSAAAFSPRSHAFLVMKPACESSRFNACTIARRRSRANVMYTLIIQISCATYNIHSNIYVI